MLHEAVFIIDNISRDMSPYCYYIEWIPYDDLKNIEKIGEGGFATVHQGEWSNGPRFVRGNQRYYYTDGPVALKKLENSQNISDEFLKEVNILI